MPNFGEKMYLQDIIIMLILSPWGLRIFQLT
jgi:hypothetical protein